MSDGSYIAISAEGLAEGDIIWVPERTSRATYSESTSSTTSFSFGTESGMVMPNGEAGTFQPGSGMGGGNFQPPSGN